MPLIIYVPKRFHGASLNLIDEANAIIDEYRGQGFILTLRQLYYQFVARDLLENKHSNYKRLGNILNDARLAGLVDWEAIEDRTRQLERNAHWEDPADAIQAAAHWFQLDKWKGQKNYVEVWIEKEALTGVIEGICNRYDVPYFACRGYTSQSEQWRAGERFYNHMVGDKKVIVLHLGDHDPSGMDMTRDNTDRLTIFTQKHPTKHITVNRLALNMDQIRQYKPPHAPAKKTDSRSPEYIRKYGDKSWELDALNPSVIRDLIEKNIKKYLNVRKFNERVALEKEYKNQLEELANNWEG